MSASIKVYKTKDERNSFFTRFLEYHYTLVEESCKRLSLEENVRKSAKALIRSFYENSSCSKKPGSIVGASIVLSCQVLNISVPKRKIAIAADVCELSLKRAYESMQNYLKNAPKNKLNFRY